MPNTLFYQIESDKEKITGYHKFLIFVLCAATFFEGYDYMVINLVLPLMGKEFDVSTQTLGYAVALINIGTIVAFLVIRTADRFGRKPLLLLTIVMYTFFTVLTAFSKTLTDFVLFQFLARIFLVSEWGLASVILAEELPARIRAFGIAIVQLAAALGAIISAVLFPWISTIEFGWRGLYLVGIIPLLLIIWLRRNMKETTRWLTRREELARGIVSKQDFFAVWSPRYRKHTAILMVMWFMAWIPMTAIQVFWTYFAINERGWSLVSVSKAMSIAYGIGLTGYLVSGKLMDILGRKPTGAIFYFGASVSICWAFQAVDPIQMYISVAFGVFFLTSFLPICSTYTTELFPTEMRANASAWTNNMIGRIGCVIAPALVGQLALILGTTGNALTAIAIGPFIMVFFIVFFFPETKQKELEEITH